MVIEFHLNQGGGKLLPEPVIRPVDPEDIDPLLLALVPAALARGPCLQAPTTLVQLLDYGNQ